jgi:hypothetical protein
MTATENGALPYLLGFITGTIKCRQSKKRFSSERILPRGEREREVSEKDETSKMEYAQLRKKSG